MTSTQEGKEWVYVDTTPLWVKIYRYFFIGVLFDCSDTRYWNSGYWEKHL